MRRVTGRRKNQAGLDASETRPPTLNTVTAASHAALNLLNQSVVPTLPAPAAIRLLGLGHSAKDPGAHCPHLWRTESGYPEQAGTDILGLTVSINGCIGTRAGPAVVGSESRKASSPDWPGGIPSCTSKVG